MRVRSQCWPDRLVTSVAAVGRASRCFSVSPSSAALLSGQYPHVQSSIQTGSSVGRGIRIREVKVEPATPSVQSRAEHGTGLTLPCCKLSAVSLAVSFQLLRVRGLTTSGRGRQFGLSLQ